MTIHAFAALSLLSVGSGLALVSPTSMPSPQILRLWAGPAPGLTAGLANSVEQTDAEGRVSNVSVPTLTMYPTAGQANGTAIIVCSGGGYRQLAVEKHGIGSAQAFGPQGITIFSLKYRVSPENVGLKAMRQQALLDAKRAIRLVRSHASEWHLNPHRIGMVGHSAGANLIANLLTDFDDGNPNSPDAIERQSCRPDFVGLMSTWAADQKLADFHFTPKTPPVFLCSTYDDTTAPITFSQSLASQLKQIGVPVHLESYDTGGHQAFTINQGAHGDWPKLFLSWLQQLHLPA